MRSGSQEVAKRATRTANLNVALAEVATEALDELAHPNVPVELTHALDIRYRGQSYELTVNLDGRLDAAAAILARQGGARCGGVGPCWPPT